MSSLTELRAAALENTLRNCQLFRGLPAADVRTIAGLTLTRALAKGDYLFHEGDPARGFFVVQTGAINVHRLSSAGKEQVIHVFRAGDSFAEATLAARTGYPAEARALEPTQVLLIQKEAFIEQLRRQPELALRMLAGMYQHLQVLVGLIEDLTLKDVESRLAHWLLKRCPDPAAPTPFALELPATKRVLAAELGTASETLSRTLAKLRRQQLLTVKGRTVTVLSPARLQAVINRASAPAGEGRLM